MGGLTALLVVLLVGVQHVVHADTNVTIDDTDTTDILYNPPSSWTESSFDPFDAGGTHMLTSDSDATATFTFTGALHTDLGSPLKTSNGLYFRYRSSRHRNLLLGALMAVSREHRPVARRRDASARRPARLYAAI